MTGQHVLVVCALALLGTAVRCGGTSTCPDEYQACGGMCYRLTANPSARDPCGEIDARYPVPRTQEQITCLLGMDSSETGLDVITFWVNWNGDTFTTPYQIGLTAPAELIGEPGPGGDTVYEDAVVIDRTTEKLVRGGLLDFSAYSVVCEKSPSN